MKHIEKIFVILSLIFSGCIEDIIEPDPNIQIESSAKLLWYLESKGDYINSTRVPSLVDAEELFNNKTNYLIIDVRDQSEFLSGHIEEAINVSADSLLSFISSRNIIFFPKVVVVSSTGQAASYYTCLLQLLGYYNVYALRFGMASWNRQFADEWLANSRDIEAIFQLFSKEIYAKPEFNELPKISYSENETVEGKLAARIKQLFSEGFNENKTLLYDAASVSFETAMNKDNPFIICYGYSTLYNFPNGIIHPEGSVQYSGVYPFYDLRSTAFLQTIPADTVIAIYSVSGHLSAFATAYLRVLGYNAKSILFGAGSVMYGLIDTHPVLREELFRESLIKNYPFVF